MRAFGLFRDRFQLQQKTVTPNGSGGSTTVWATVATVPGTVYAVTREMIETDEGSETVVQPHVDLVLESRTGTLTGAMRVIAPDGRTFELLSLSAQDGYSVCRARQVAA